ncbi:N-acetylmuramoyl-L-alanine amidase family protein [Paraurantiacibacter namhicola]|uniref:N-acetylmuramoyl-L-alanine amidase n=1 Tax=Paraurantiacibacter namhicola TaxID=645517 RepID=A0A1C7D9G1_9SPHN|nr:N-acetylmuramoyl-L-alanine amidase [Paraurantiacibacter namhicola]ANU08120.1 N-acetylmuramoyl-L-alanine amidase AmiA precursor [Paraurantiacibacter namhicola]
MWHRLQIALVFLAPVVLMGGLYVFGLTIPVPHLGRDYVVRLALPDPDAPRDLPEVLGPEDSSRPLVVIDAGHGGHDPGASGGGYKEKTVVLGLALALRDELLRQGGVRVALTRSDDRFLVVEERFQIARALGADLFISIHADSAGEQASVSGASIYVLSDEASSEAAARFAERENEADQVNGVVLAGTSQNVNDILVDLAQRRSSEGSGTFAALIEREGRGTLTFHPQTQRSAGLRVLRAPDVPSVLYEAGFITNEGDAARLASPEGQRRFADVMSRAVRIFFARQSGA